MIDGNQHIICTTLSMNNMHDFKLFKQSRLPIKKETNIKHVNAKIKTFKILGEKYRNRRKRFGLRFNLICTLIDYDRKFGINYGL